MQVWRSGADGPSQARFLGLTDRKGLTSPLSVYTLACTLQCSFYVELALDSLVPVLALPALAASVCSCQLRWRVKSSPGTGPETIATGDTYRCVDKLRWLSQAALFPQLADVHFLRAIWFQSGPLTDLLWKAA